MKKKTIPLLINPNFMLKETKAFSSFSVDDLAIAKDFYENSLDLKVVEKKGMGLELHIPGSMPVFVYPKDNHEPATFTVLNFMVQDIDKAVDALTQEGVAFEHYEDMKTDEKGISRQDTMSIAWFKDPAGNIISMIEES